MNRRRTIRFTPRKGWREHWRRKHEKDAEDLRRLMPTVFHANRKVAEIYGDDINNAVHEVMLLPQPKQED